MIEPNDVIPSLLTACPGFEVAWRDHLAWWGNEERGHYNDVSVFAHYIVAAYGRDDTEWFPAAFAAIERLIIDGTEEVQGLAIVGILEGVQNIASHQSFGATVFVPWLQPHSQAAWLDLIELWGGKPSLADVIRAERQNLREG